MLLGVSLTIDRLFLPGLVKMGALADFSWDLQDKKYIEYMFARNEATRENPIWRSSGWPVSIEKKKPHRILVVGDSYVWGNGYANMNTLWWRQLARELERRGYNDVEVVGAGMSSTTTRDELQWIKKLVPKYKPDIVLVGYVVNDPEEVNPKTGLKFIRDPLESQTFKDPMPQILHDVIFGLWPNLSERIYWIHRNILRNKLTLSGREVDLPTWELELLKGDNFERYKEGVSEIAGFARSSSTPIVFIATPTNWADNARDDATFLKRVHDYHAERYAPIKRAFDQNGVRFIDTLDRFIDCIKGDAVFEANKRQLINPVNRHPHNMATRFYAVEAANLLENDYPHVLGKKTAAAPHQLSINDWIPPVLVRQLSTNRYEICFPHSTDELLSMPINKPYVQLNLERPCAIRGMKLSGQCVTAGDIYVSLDLPGKHYDTDNLVPLGHKEGDTLSWTIKDEEVARNINTIRVCPDLKGANRNVVLELLPDKAVGDGH